MASRPTTGFDMPGPSHDALYNDIAIARSRGVGNPDKSLLDLGALLWVAQLVSSAGDDAAKIEDTLRRAVKRLGGMSAKSVEALFGLSDKTRGHDVSFRRKEAAAEYGHKAIHGFRTRYEIHLLMAVTTNCYILIAEEYLRRHFKVSDWPTVLLENGWGEAELGNGKTTRFGDLIRRLPN